MFKLRPKVCFAHGVFLARCQSGRNLPAPSASKLGLFKMGWPPPGKDLPLNSPAIPDGRLGAPHSMRFPLRVSQSRGLEFRTKLPCSLGHLLFKNQGSAGTWPPPCRQTSTAPPKLPKRARLGGLCQVAAEARTLENEQPSYLFKTP